MARKPVTTYAGGKGPRQRIWETIRLLAGRHDAAPFTEGLVWMAMSRADNIEISPDAIRDYRRALVAAGVLGIVSEARDRRVPATYCLLSDEGLEAPRVRRDGSRVTQGLAQEQMWRTLRLVSGDTNARELAAHAATAVAPVALSAAEHYLGTLHAAGYLIRTHVGRGLGKAGKGLSARYRLNPARNTGPRPPMICRTKVVYDPNENRVVWAPVVTDEDAIYGT